MNRLYLYGVIGEGELTAQGVQNKLEALKDKKEIDVHINSGGGSVVEGNAIYTMLKQHNAKIKVHIDSLAASIASVIAMAGDEVNIASNGLFMIHNAHVLIQGNGKELEKMAETLEKVTSTIRQSYMSRNIKLSEEKLIKMMDAETWLTASEALNFGFVDSITKSEKVSASLTKKQLNFYNNVPEDIAEDDEEESDESSDLKSLLEKIVEKLDEVLERLDNREEVDPEEEEEIQNTLNLLRKWR